MVNVNHVFALIFGVPGSIRALVCPCRCVEETKVSHRLDKLLVFAAALVAGILVIGEQPGIQSAAANNKYGAIAFSTSSGAHGFSYNYNGCVLV